MSRPVVIVNPEGGAGLTARGLRHRLDFLGDPAVHETRSAGDARRIAREAAEAKAPLVVAVGGDGTLNEILNGLAPDFGACTLAIVPGGTGNDTVRSLGLPTDLDDAFEVLADAWRGPSQSRVGWVDVMEIFLDGSRRWALNAATGGFGGAVNQEMTEEVRDLWGPFAYARAATSVAGEPPIQSVTVAIDGGEAELLDVVSLVVANGGVAAHGVTVAPGASVDDGRLAVHAVLEAGLVDRLAIAAALLTGSLPDHEAYRSWTCEQVAIRCETGFPVSVDGELVEAHEMRYAVIPAPLRILGNVAG